MNLPIFVLLLRFVWFNGLIIPLLATFTIVGWKLLARPGSPVAEDGAIGIDLLVAAGVTQLSFLGSYVSNLRSIDELLRFRISLGVDVMLLISAVLFATAIVIRFFGYLPDPWGLPRRLHPFWGIKVPNIVGYVHMGLVFACNAFPSILYPVLHNRLL